MIQKKDGIVLILILFLIAILSVVVLESLKQSEINGFACVYERNTVDAYHRLKSVESLEKALLIKDAKDNNYDTLFDVWNNKEKMEKLNGYDKKYFSKINFRMEDECGKFPINMIADKKNGKLYRSVFMNLLMDEPFNLKKVRAAKIVFSVWYWIDKDGFEKQNKTAMMLVSEDIDIDKMFSAKVRNAPIRTLGELFFIKTIDKKMLYSSKNKKGLFNLLTPYCFNGKININTAPKEIIMALVSSDISQDTKKEFANSVVKYRSDEFHRDLLKKPDWYQSKMPGFNDIILPNDIITTSSHWFRLIINDNSSAPSLNAVEILHREKKKSEYKVKTVYKEVY